MTPASRDGGAGASGSAAPGSSSTIRSTNGRSPTVRALQPPFGAVIFDLDGVVTDTAAVHESAWRELFDAALQDPRLPREADTQPFAHADYLEHVDGRPREEGVAEFLRSRGIHLPRGEDADSPERWTVRGLAARKDALFLRHLAADGVHVFPESVDLVMRLRAGGIPVAVVTASRNAHRVLEAAGLSDSFDLVLDGVEAARLGLPGKPEPAVFLEAARRIGVDPSRAVVVEDAEAGVLAAHRGKFGLVVGIDRTGTRRAQLEEAGATLVLHDLGELDLGLVLADPWTLVYRGSDAEHEGHREALTTLGNGYIGVRGAAPESRRSGPGYPGTYLGGVYNRVVSLVHGLEAEDEHMVNAPNWLHLDLRTPGGRWWSEGGLRLRHERRRLDLAHATLRREAVLEDDAGRRLRLLQRRLVSMAAPHLMALETTVTAEGWDGEVELRSGVDLDVANENVLEDALLAHVHLRDVTPPGMDPAPADLVAEAETLQSLVRIAVALRHTVEGTAEGEDPASYAGRVGSLHYRQFTLPLRRSTPVRVTKTAGYATSRDHAVSSALTGALDAIDRAPRTFAALLAEHSAAWERLLRLFTVRLDASVDVQPVLNLHVFHVLQTLAPFVEELDVGVPARGLHGEGYRGHVFWDELFVLPLITSRIPAVARSLLAYRWRRLPAARRAAAEAGLEGALFPWQSGSDGREETPRWIFNRRSGHWIPDVSRLQRHVGLAVGFSAWQYFEATQDRFWLLRHGAELIVEVARLFASLAEHDAAADRFHVRGVMGPDEYHTGYPGRAEPGLDDNAYTNVMAAWLCERACRCLSTLQGHDRDDLVARLGIRPEELERWEHLGRRMAVPFHGDGIISQFAGYGDLAELDWDAYRARYGNIERLDLILEAEGDTTNRYRLAKQADTLMLLYLLGQEELLAVLARLGYSVTAEQLDCTVGYYLARTAHGSTLSRVAHASVLALTDPEQAWDTFRDVLDADLDDTQGGTTQTGIHLGAMAGSIDVVQRTFAGMRLTGDALVFAPRLPREVCSVGFRVRYRDQLLDVTLTPAQLALAAAPGDAAPVRIRVGAHEALLAAGASCHFTLES
ncbi:beta-phosphoglucomutase [Sinomonas cellulolyticus]|uniref:Beta-phosphoglucomutase family hydrolase n=1 Tax=Sinomonas cellulolyticus TaxID=2801916 RepID=A0ABS1K259_9MICC|nr:MULTISPECIES: beta-phosphoglucomutase family hydrolase [Sinomonas]MBL0705563.1 beta-phosphoglucomutase family hydrolase [Sinomonas cellulolyticus]GHG51353.1 beta-phosphoglucomutase [Sinomonas sp. KCTC 49339]